METQNKTKMFALAILGVLGIILLSSFALAGAVCGTGTVCMSNVSSPTTSSHDSDLTFSFNVTYEGTAANTTLNFSTSTTNIGTWKTLPSDTTSINQNQTLQLTATLNVPKHSSGTINPVLNVVTGTSATDSISFPVVAITEAPAISTAITQSLSATQNGLLNVSNVGNKALNNINLSWSGDFNLTFSSNNFGLGAGTSSIVTVTSPLNLSALDFGRNTATVTAKDLNENVQASSTFTIDKGFCKAGEIGTNLTIRDISIDNEDGDDEEWKILDEITIEVDVENDGSTDIKDVIVELGLFDSKGKNKADDLKFQGDNEDDEEKIDLGKINDDDRETAIFQFRIPADFDDGSYKLAIKVYSDDEKEENLCVDSADDFSDDFFEDIDVERESDDDKIIVVDDLEINPKKVTAGDKVVITFDVFNIGDDEDQDKVQVNIISTALGLNVEEVIKNLDSGDGESVEVIFTVPSSVKDGEYTISVDADYEYNSNKGKYTEQSDETWNVILEVFGGTSLTEAFVDVTAELDADSEAKAGEEMVIKATIKNSGNETETFVVDAKGFDSWATLSSVSDRIFTLNAGEIKDVEFTFDVDKDASGEETFNIETIAGEKTDVREVAVNVEGKRSLTSGIKSLFGGSSLIWVIAAINIILIVLIIVVAVSLSRR